jgi:hypothetical protein
LFCITQGNADVRKLRSVQDDLLQKKSHDQLGNVVGHWNAAVGHWRALLGIERNEIGMRARHVQEFSQSFLANMVNTDCTPSQTG